MDSTKSIIFQRADSEKCIDALSEFGYVLLSAPVFGTASVQEPSVKTWLGEDGEDVYIPSGGLPIEAFDVEIELGSQGLQPKAAVKSIVALRDWLAGGMFAFYAPITATGYSQCYFKEMSDIEVHFEGNTLTYTVTITVRVTQPKLYVLPVSDADGNITKLTESSSL
ncbi:MAG: hypothetical protein LIP09_14275 [Bacteroidales bacterium]|nr:hypothetical protein [Bacteroidales bacterium]MCC8119895.1 hypothetical protein [Bacteroidales bacterium]